MSCFWINVKFTVFIFALLSIQNRKKNDCTNITIQIPNCVWFEKFLSDSNWTTLLKKLCVMMGYFYWKLKHDETFSKFPISQNVKDCINIGDHCMLQFRSNANRNSKWNFYIYSFASSSCTSISSKNIHMSCMGYVYK